MQIDIVRAWKDEAYRSSLSDEERCALPENPVGEIELTDADLETVYGGQSTNGIGCSIACNSVACGSVVCNSAVCHSAICTIIGHGCG